VGTEEEEGGAKTSLLSGLYFVSMQNNKTGFGLEDKGKS